MKGTYGEIITLYRAEGRQINKPTQNWASTKEGAMQYGSHVIKREIPIDNILALNTGISGKYEEFIVGKKPEYERGGKRFSSGGVMELLAPNGKPSNLTPEQYKLVRTPAFKNWFGDWLKAYDTKDYNGVSKVIDENGEPRVMFHGSNSIHEITTFQPTSGKPYSFFAADINEAGRYTNMLNHIKPFFIKAKRDYDVRHLSKEEQAQTGALFDKNWAELYIQLRKNLMISEVEELAYDTMKIDHLPEIFNIDYSDYESGKWLELARKTITAKDKNFICEFLWQVLTKTTNDWMLLETDVFQQYLDDNNYDGFWTTEGWNGNIAVYNSRNIKLADGSNTTFDPNNPDIRYSHGGSLSADQKEIYDKWKSLVNMSVGDLSNFYHTKEGKEAGLTKDEADMLGIHNGRESARWILKMKKTPVAEWTPEMWEWAKRQISFISRMKGNKGGLYDENGNKTRKHTSLLLWGHNPEYAKGGGIELLAPNGKPSNLIWENKSEVKLEEGGQLALFSEVEKVKLTPASVRGHLIAQRESEPEPQLTMLSYGGGQDGYSILLSIIYDKEFRKKYAPNDFFVAMSDTGNEFPFTYQHIKDVEALCKANNISFKFITPDMGFHTPGWQNLKAPLIRNKMILAAWGNKLCTINLKVNVVDKYMHDYMCKLYGFGEQRDKTGWDLYHQKFKTKARVIIGFAKDEEVRAIKSQKGHEKLSKWKQKHMQYVYPMIEEGWNRASAQKVIAGYNKPVPPPSNCMICFYQSDQELVYLDRNHPEEFKQWVELERAKLERFRAEGLPDKNNLGVYGVGNLEQKLAKAKAKYGNMTNEELWEYKMSHGHCIKQAF